MLEIFIKDTRVDLSSDISISLSYENPFFLPDGISTPYSLSFDLPRTANNLALIGNAHRVASNRFSSTMAARICFDGLELLRGVVEVERISKDSIEVGFNSSDILPTTNKYLHEHDLGRISFGNATFEPEYPSRPVPAAWNTYLPVMECIAFWESQALLDYPEFVAPPMVVKGVGWTPPDDEYASSNLNQRLSRINNYGVSAYLGTNWSVSKILPAIQLCYILNNINPNFGVAFSDPALKRVMLVTSYHPAYQTNNNEAVWTFDPQTGECYINLADFMPLINTGEFICESLKLICSSVFIVGGTPVVSSRAEILQSNNPVDWSRIVIGTPTIEFRLAEKYVLEYADTSQDDPLPAERILTNISSVSWMVASTVQNASMETALKTFMVSGTEQVFEQRINSQLSSDTKVHYDYALVQDQATLDKREDDASGAFDVSIKASHVRMVVATDMLKDTQMTPDFSSTNTTRHDYIYCPEIEAPDKTRPERLIFGMYLGKRSSLLLPSFQYPFMSSDSSDAYNSKPSSKISLEVGGSNGLVNTYHSQFKAWVEKDKRVVKVDVLLNSLDLHNLDLRRKVYLEGRHFLISELFVNLKLRSIEVAEVTLVEA